MDRIKLLEENLREAACIGDIDTVEELLSKGIEPNAKHDINGWTALHWAAKRGHKDIVALLLEHGADMDILTEKGECPLSLATRPEVRQLLGADPGSMIVNQDSSLPITPSYLKNPPLHSKVDAAVYSNGGGSSRRSRQQNHHGGSAVAHDTAVAAPHGGGGSGHSQNQMAHAANGSNDELVLKVRVANSGDPDFMEVELPQNELTYYTLLRVCCEELGITTSQVIRIRKLPDTMIRKDKDVQRLANFQEIELVVAGQHGLAKAGPNGIIFPSGPTANGYQSIHLYKNQTILY
ncbi:hypothetical protein LSTR_LSTR008650 [Laodelphax striatellus]|uniref:Uncharacterized protein n=1 Tax=Laodelphax striatellus TaxID=195883 RepID=A0A482WM43_LAOST|nr:hypothetical protein LSTR_LSTR008650 [Laodelphax striatellus]